MVITVSIFPVSLARKIERAYHQAGLNLFSDDLGLHDEVVRDRGYHGCHPLRLCCGNRLRTA